MGGLTGAREWVRESRTAGVFSVPALSWAFYDFANTIFSYAVMTRYFNDWIVVERDHPDYYLGLMGLAVSLLLVFALPFLGAVADRGGRRKPLLVAFTLVCVAATALLGLVNGTLWLLVIAGVAVFGFQAALAQYDPLLADVAPPEARGRVSGLGVGLGYVGVLVGFVVLDRIVAEGRHQEAFIPTAILYLACALPCFLFVRERRTFIDTLGEAKRLAREATLQFMLSVRHAREHRDVTRFLIARFLYVDAIATVIAYMVVYARRSTDFNETNANALIGVSVAAAALGAFVGGYLVERLGPKRVLLTILGLFVGALVVEGATGSTEVMWLAGPIVGVSLGVVWTSDRVFLFRLAPPELRGELFGLYGLVGRLSSGVGPLVFWAGTIWLLSDATDVAGEPVGGRVALVVLAAAAAAGAFVLRPLSDAPRHAG
jgi:UMF1 family MFS transporter